MTCTGKTLVAAYWAERFDLIIIFSPLKIFAKQNLERFEAVLDDHYSLLVDSEGTRDEEEIKKMFDKKLILSCTYKSADVIANLIDDIIKNYKLDKIGVVGDEFHNYTIKSLFDKNDSFNKILQLKCHLLNMSATPRIYELENNDNEAISKQLKNY